MSGVLCIPALTLFAAIGLNTAAFAQGGARPSDYAPIVLHVACGGLFKTVCANVVPKIAVRSLQSGVDLKPEGSGRVFDTADAVCQGQAAAAIVQRDAIALVARQFACVGRYDVVGRPIYPYYAFLIVRGDAPFRQLNDMPGHGRRPIVMAGAEGTGGQITFGFLLRSDPALQRAIAVTAGDLEVGLQRLADGSIDGFFTVDTLDSDMIDRVRLKSDTHGRPLYAFIDIRPGPDFFRANDGLGHCLYRPTALDFGEPLPVTTISLDGIMVLGRAYRDAHAKGGPRVFDAVSSAIDAAEAGILTALKSPSDWRPVGTSCQ